MRGGGALLERRSSRFRNRGVREGRNPHRIAGTAVISETLAEGTA